MIVGALFSSTLTATDSKISPSPVFPLETRWVMELDTPLAAAPAFDLLYVYVPLRDGSLSAVRLVDGEVIWSAECETQHRLAVGADVLVAASDHTLVGIRSSDGLKLWTSDVGSTVSAAPVWNNGWLIAVLESGEVVVLRAQDGQEFWRRQLSGSLVIEPSVGGRNLFVPVADGRIVALDLVTGDQVWEHTVGGSPREILATDDLFVGSTDNFFYRLSRHNGEWLWRWRTGADIIGRPATNARQVLFVSLDNVLRALDRKSGVQQWRRPLAGRPTAGPTIVGNVVLVAGVAPSILAFDTKTGLPAGTLAVGADFFVPPHVLNLSSPAGPGIIAATGDRRLLAILRALGPPTFSITFPPAPLLPAPERFKPAEVLPFEPLPESPPASGEILPTGVGGLNPPEPPALPNKIEIAVPPAP